MEDLKTLKKMIYKVYHVLTHKQRQRMIPVFVVMLIGSLFELLGVSAILPFVESITSPQTLRDRWYMSGIIRLFPDCDDKKLILISGLFIVLVYIIKNTYMMWSSYVQAKFTNGVQKDLTIKMYHCFMNRPYEYFASATGGEILQCLNGDAANVYTVIQYFFLFLSKILNICLIVGYLYIVNRFLTLGVVVLGMLCFIGIVLSIKKKISNAGEVARNAVSQTNEWSMQTIVGIKEFFVFSKRELAERKYGQLYESRIRANIIYEFVSACPTYIIEMICASGIILLLLVQMMLGLDMSTFVPKMSVFAMGAFRLLPAIAAASGYVSVFIFHRPAIDKAYENYINAEEYMKDVREVISSEDDKSHVFEKEIRIDDICWKYSDSTIPVIENLNLTIHKGDSIGIIGESGAGKSTLADLILQLYRPQRGHIYMDGIDINTIPDSWNSNIGYVSQELFLLNGTVRENVAFCEESVDDEKVWNALEKASLKAFIESLPDKLDTVVGERGIKFSGGQRQRMAIARALYTDPHILVLDEATSALDNETELSVMDAIDCLKGRITLIIIAHRLSTISNCSRVFEIKNGKAVEHDVTEFKQYAIQHEDSQS